MTTPVTLAELLSARQNGFGPLRLMLALSVVLSHSFVLTSGLAETQPLYAATGETLGQHAVEAFFVISGILISASLARSEGLSAFLAARAARILPALVMCVLATAFVVAPVFSRLPLVQYLSSAEPYLYVLKTASLSTGAAPLPGVFEALPVAGRINVPLYTLKYEVICYALLALTALAGLFRHRQAMTALALLAVIGSVAIQALHIPGAEGAESLLPRFLSCFAVGVLAWQWREHVSIGAVQAVLSMGLYLLSIGTIAQWLLGPVATALLALSLAKLSWGYLGSLADRYDLSYGTYVWGWLIQQCVVATLPGISWLPHFLISLAVLLPIAFLSWTLVEAPALAWAKARRHSAARHVATGI